MLKTHLLSFAHPCRPPLSVSFIRCRGSSLYYTHTQNTHTKRDTQNMLTQKNHQLSLVAKRCCCCCCCCLYLSSMPFRHVFLGGLGKALKGVETPDHGRVELRCEVEHRVASEHANFVDVTLTGEAGGVGVAASSDDGRTDPNSPEQGIMLRFTARPVSRN